MARRLADEILSAEFALRRREAFWEFLAGQSQSRGGDQPAAQASAAAPAPLTREQAVAALVAVGKIMGRGGYREKDAVRDVRKLCAAKESDPGYDRRTLRDLFHPKVKPNAG